MKKPYLIILTLLLLLLVGCTDKKTTDMDVVNSVSSKSGDKISMDIIVLLNGYPADNQETCAKQIIEHFIADDFQTIKFFWDDNNYPYSLSATVYEDKKAKVNGEPLFSFDYAIDFDSPFTMADNPEEFTLTIR